MEGIIEKNEYKSLAGVLPQVEKLYFKGNVDLLNDGLIRLAVVGSRRVSDYGRWVLKNWIEDFVRSNMIVVSGFMYGVDQLAHRECVVKGGKTIAILGWGIGRKVSGEDEKLFDQILDQGGLILSEYEGDMSGTKWSFPRRNRIVSGISDAVLVIEAGLNSGSLITAKYAVNQEKKLFAVPGGIDREMSKGTNWLIKNCKAEVATTSRDVLDIFGLNSKYQLSKSDTTDPILELLKFGDKSLDEIASVLRIDANVVAARLTELMLMGEVCEWGGKYKRGVYDS